MLQTMSFVAYLLLGALVFSKIEGWKYLDAVYWADVTLLTVGLGDFSPQTHTGRGLLFPFAIGGILIIGLVIGSIRSLVLERGEQKLSARIVEKRRSTAVNNVGFHYRCCASIVFADGPRSTSTSKPLKFHILLVPTLARIQTCLQRSEERKSFASCARFAPLSLHLTINLTVSGAIGS